MRRLVYVVMLLLLQSLMTNVLAGERTKEEMRMAALNALTKSNKARGKTVTARTSDLKEYVTKDKLSVIGSDALGFAVVTSDDRFDEVIGCSMSTFSDEMPCGFKWWMETAEKVMENTKGQAATSRKVSRSTKVSIAPLMTTKWGQERPFWDNCTFTYNGSTYQCVTGCVATAMAQVMNYHKYPERGTGSNSYNITYNESFTITFEEDFSQSVYDWDNMLDDYSSYYGKTTKDTHTIAVAKLMKDCGVSVYMSYSNSSYGSSASTSSIESALINNFSYSNDTKIYSRSHYSGDWMDLVYGELKAGRPIIYRGESTSSGGHAFVLHGYDASTGQVYVNWGWDGSCDGYYDIDLLNPKTQTKSYSFSQYQAMVVAIPGTVQPVVDTKYNLTISATGNGSISYNGNSIRSNSSTYSLDKGSSATLTFSPDNGYQIKSVTINNVDVTSQVYNNSYTVSSISKNTTVSVVFEAIPTSTYTLSITATGNGTVSYNNNSIRGKTSTFSVVKGISATLTIAPDDGFQIKSVTLNGGDLTPYVSNNLTIEMSSDITVSVVFEAIPSSNLTLSITASGNGSVSYGGNIIKDQTSTFSIDNASSTTLTITPDDGYKINNVTVNNVDVTSLVSDNKYTLSNISSNTIVIVVFASNSINPSDYKSYAEFEVDGIRYKPTYGSDEVDVTKKTEGYSGSITIPSVVVYNGLPYRVTKIGTSAFKDCVDLQEVMMSDGIMEIGISAFYGCNALTKITLPNSIIEIKSHAFNRCSTLANITLPNSITAIASSLFYNCTNLQNITIPNGVTSIGDYAFYQCKSLIAIDIPNNVTSIGVSSFEGCDNLYNVVLSDNITSLPKSVFSGCSNLKTINIPQSVVSIDEKALSWCNLQFITIPANVNTIGEYAFSGNDNLKDVFCLMQNPPLFDYSLNLNSNATIYVYPQALEAYQSAYYWKDFKIVGLNNEGMEYFVKNGYSKGINDYLSCSMTGIRLSNVYSITKTFYLSITNNQNNAITITSVVARDPITEDQLSIILDESKLGELNGGDTKCFSVDINKDLNPIFDIYYTYNGKLCLLNTDAIDDGQYDLIIQTSANGVVTCNDFTSDEQTTITLKMKEGSSCTLNISPYVGYRIKSITVNGTDVASQVLDNQLTISSITANTNVFVEFEKNPYLYSVTFEVDGIKYMSKRGIDEVDVVSKSEGYSGNVTIPSTVTNNELPYRVTGIYGSAFSSCSNLAAIVIPNSVTDIGNYSFQGCTNLQEIVLSENLTSIGNSTFSGCTSLAAIIIPKSVTSIGTYCFQGCTNLQEIILSENLTSLPDRVFSKCTNLKKVNIPDKVTSISDYAFYECNSLVTIVVPNSVTSIGKSAFEDCYSLQEMILPENLTSLPEKVFFCCKNLKEVNIPENVTSIGEYAFSGCNSLTSVIFPDKVTSIDEGAFYLCNFQSIVIPANVKAIGQTSFGSNDYLRDVCCLAQTPPSLANTFDNMTTVYVYQEALDAYKTAENWKNYKIVGLGKEDMDDITKNGFHYSEGINNYLDCGITGVASSGYTIGSTSYITKAIGLFVTNNHNDAITITRVLAKDPTTGDPLAMLEDESMLGEVKGGETKEFSVTINKDVDPVYEIFYIYNGKPCLLNTNATGTRQFDLTIQATGSGTVTCNDQTANNNSISLKVDAGKTCTLVMTPNNGYRLKSVTINDVDVTSQVNDNSYTISSISSNTTVSVVFEAIPVTTYTLSISATGNGSVSYSGNSIRSKTSTYSLDEGSLVTLSIIPDEGYRIKSVIVNDVDVTLQVKINSYTIGNISSNTAVSVVFEAIPVTTYTLSISVTGNGSVSYSGSSIRSKTSTYSLDEGSSATLTITPDEGYRIKSVTLNNVDVTSSISNNQFVTNNVSSDLNIAVVFEEIPVEPAIDYNLFVTCSGNSISKTLINGSLKITVGLEMANSGTEDIIVTKLILKDPDSGGVVSTITDTSIIGQLKGGTDRSFSIQIFTSIDKLPTCELVYTLKNKEYTYVASNYRILSLTANDYGNLTFSGISVGSKMKKFSLTPGDDATIGIVPIEGAVFTKLTVGGDDVTSSIANNQYTISNITSNISVSAIFDMNSEDIQTIDGHQYVDLGLSSGSCWSTVNYGATKPEEAGSYLSRASIYWGEHWTVPSKEEMQELIDECEWTWTELNGQNGYRVKGPNGNSIFLPAAGWSSSTWGTSSVGTSLYYFTSSEASYGSSSWVLSGNSSEYQLKSISILLEEYPVRPISTIKNKKVYDVSDIVSLVNFVMGVTVAEKKDFSIYDLNHDEDLDIGDMILVIKEIIKNMNNQSMARATRATDSHVDLSRFTAAQFIVSVPADKPIADINLTGRNSQTHRLFWQEIGAGEYAVVVYSLTNQTLSPENGNIIDVTCADGKSIDIITRNVILSTSEGERVWLNSLPSSSAPTGISGLEDVEAFDIYDMSGRKVRSQCHSLEGIASGVYIINGKKTVIK